MNSSYNEHLFLDQDDNLGLEQTYEEIPSSTLGFYQVYGQQDTFNPPSYSPNVIDAHSNSPFLSMEARHPDKSSMMFNGQDMELYKIPYGATENSQSFVPPQTSLTNTVRVSEQLPTAGYIFPAQELPLLATSVSASRAPGISASSSSPENLLSSEALNQLSRLPDQQQIFPQSSQARESGSSKESSEKQLLRHSSSKGKSKFSFPSIVRPTLENPPSYLHNYVPQLEGSDVHPNPQTLMEEISPITKERCDKGTLSNSMHLHKPSRLDRKTRIPKVGIKRSLEKDQVDGHLSRKKMEAKVAAGKQTPSAQSDVDKISGWGWRARGDSDEWPKFGDTTEICPLFDENGQSIRTALQGTFNFSRGQKGRVSNDDGELVHELQKRNIFHVKDMCYTLASPSRVSTSLVVKHENVFRRVQNLSVALIARDFDGEFKNSRETPLETRGKAREFIAARRWNMNVVMKPWESGDSRPDVRLTRTLDQVSLPDTTSATHLEFRHATPGNKTMGVWRLPTQHYYRLVMQLCANLDGVDGLVIVAERSTELLLVRGRPPGGREEAERNPSQACTKQARRREVKAPRPSSCKKQKRRHHNEHEDEEDDWANDLAQDPIIENFQLRAGGERTPWDVQGDVDGGPTSRHYNTRTSRKRKYLESDADEDNKTNDEDGEYEVDDSAPGYWEEEIEQRSKIETRVNLGDGHDKTPNENPDRSLYQSHKQVPQQSVHTYWRLTDANPGPGNEHQAARQTERFSQTFGGDSDDDYDSVINDPMGIEAVLDEIFDENAPAQPAPGHLRSYPGEFNSNDTQDHAPNHEYPEPQTGSSHAGVISELPVSEGNYPNLQLQIWVPEPEISLHGATASNSNTESESSTSIVTPRRKVQYDQGTNRAEAIHFMRMQSPDELLLDDSFHGPSASEDFSQEFPWDF